MLYPSASASSRAVREARPYGFYARLLWEPPINTQQKTPLPKQGRLYRKGKGKILLLELVAGHVLGVQDLVSLVTAEGAEVLLVQSLNKGALVALAQGHESPFVKALYEEYRALTKGLSWLLRRAIPAS